MSQPNALIQSTPITTTSLAQASASLTHNYTSQRSYQSNYNAVIYSECDDIQSHSIVETDIDALKKLKSAKYIRSKISSTARIQQRVSELHDDLHISHWHRNDYLSTEYRWSKFDKRLKQLQYDTNDYDTLLNSTEWTRQETDQLMSLCTQYDCRWYVIYDRWMLLYNELYENHNAHGNNQLNEEGNTINNVSTSDVTRASDIDMTGTSANGNLDVVHSTTTTAAAPITDSLIVPQHSEIRGNSKPISVSSHKLKSCEDLKHRYYTVQRILMKSRNSSDIELHRHTLFYNNFDPEYEEGRKDELVKLYNRDPCTVDDIIPYVLEYRKLSSEIIKLKKQIKYDKIKQKNAIALKAGHMHKNSLQHKKRKNSVNDDLSIPNNISLTLTQPLADIPAECIPSSDILPQYGNCYLRSTQLNSMAVLNPRLSQLMDKQLALLNIRKNNQLLINVPTGVVAEMYDRLRSDIVLLDNLNRYCNEKERIRDSLANNKKHKIG